jgi:NAD(P)-dependent dehydrogenase (short-subunit alcohol dehydrogenase family)
MIVFEDIKEDLMTILSLLKKNGISGFGYGSTAEQVTEGLDLTGQTYLITGCNSGLGLETLRVLSKRGATIIALARTTEKGQSALEMHAAKGQAIECELSEPSSVRACIQTIKEQELIIDAMICNAGIMALPKPVIHHGHELQFWTNHIGHSMLVLGLLDSLADDGRVVILSSSAHKRTYKEGIRFNDLAAQKGYSAWGAYGQSKLANLLFAKHLAKKFEGTKKTANAVHPGVISTNLGRHINSTFILLFKAVGRLFLKTIPQGAATQCYVAVHPNTASISGKYFADNNIANTSKYGQDEALAEKFWLATEEILATID